MGQSTVSTQERELAKLRARREEVEEEISRIRARRTGAQAPAPGPSARAVVRAAPGSVPGAYDEQTPALSIAGAPMSGTTKLILGLGALGLVVLVVVGRKKKAKA